MIRLKILFIFVPLLFLTWCFNKQISCEDLQIKTEYEKAKKERIIQEEQKKNREIEMKWSIRYYCEKMCYWSRDYRKCVLGCLKETPRDLTNNQSE